MVDQLTCNMEVQHVIHWAERAGVCMSCVTFSCFCKALGLCVKGKPAE